MMSLSKILRFIPVILNGAIYAGYEINGQRYRAQPIKQKQDVMIVGLPKSKVVTVDLAGQLEYDMLVTSIDADLTEDDGKTLQLDKRGNYRFSYAQIVTQVISRKTNKVVKTLSFFISSYPNYTNQIVLSPDYIYKMTANQNINSITFTGEPVYKPAPIVILGNSQSQIDSSDDSGRK